ncbi:GDSL-type esterase/lipase family protein [Marinimicrobium alkaliphilum]|uniref:GDSL-type esterase/lipase family protein n=1 Tax=Marinimicrobium alkaliphilum TaxID=2202654 RepID=UPI000DBA73B0|nr:GDSL-type esterase/lipase family protein [Marinimicrobium alkaliphilum]
MRPLTLFALVSGLFIGGCNEHITASDPKRQLLPGDGSLERLHFLGDQADAAEQGQLGDDERYLRWERDGERLALRWHQAWGAGVQFDLHAPVLLEPYRRGGFGFTVELEPFTFGGVDLALLAPGGVERRVSIESALASLAGQGEQAVFLPMHCVIHPTDHFLASTTPLRIGLGGSGNLTVGSITMHTDPPDDALELPCPNPNTAAVTPEPLQTFWAESWWLPRHRAKLAEAADNDPEIVFLGDSITQGWDEAGREVFEAHFGQWQTLNLGFSGDRTENVLWRLREGQVDTIDPALVVLMIGTNNTGHRRDHPARVAEGIEAILTELHQRLPETKVLLLAIFPRGEGPDDAERRNNDLINARIRQFGDEQRVFYRDLNAIFLDRQGILSPSVMPDLLHPEAYGYNLLAEALVPEIEALLGEE